MQSNQRSFIAGEDIAPSLFVDVSAKHAVSVSDLAGVPYGISHEGTREAPIPGNAALTALSGESVLVYGPGDACEVLAGAAVAAGKFLKPDANGKAIIALPGENYYAQTVNAVTAADQKLKVTIIRGVVPEAAPAVDAAGSVQGDAAALGAGLNVVNAADGTKGVILPAAYAGLKVRVYNTVAASGLKIYPAVGDDINDGATDAAITIEGKSLAILEAVDGVTWAASFVANV